MCWSTRKPFVSPWDRIRLLHVSMTVFNTQARTKMLKWRNRISSAIGNFHLKVFQEPKSKLQVLHLVN